MPRAGRPQRTPEERQAEYRRRQQRLADAGQPHHVEGGYRRNHPPASSPHRPAYFRLRRYGITEEQFQEMLAAQDNACAICTVPFAEDAKVCVDHCHDTGKVRGLLCDGCNVGLGKFKDDVQLVAAALEYLRKLA